MSIKRHAYEYRVLEPEKFRYGWQIRPVTDDSGDEYINRQAVRVAEDWVFIDVSRAVRPRPFHTMYQVQLQVEDAGLHTGVYHFLPQMPQLFQDIEEMCRRNGLSRYVEVLEKRIPEIYPNVKAIKRRLVEDPEIPGYQRVRFEVHLTGEPSEILRCEEEFHKVFFKEVPEHKQEFFSFTYRVI